jgi:hypothetical protein
MTLRDLPVERKTPLKLFKMLSQGVVRREDILLWFFHGSYPTALIIYKHFFWAGNQKKAPPVTWKRCI